MRDLIRLAFLLSAILPFGAAAAPLVYEFAVELDRVSDSGLPLDAVARETILERLTYEPGTPPNQPGGSSYTGALRQLRVDIGSDRYSFEVPDPPVGFANVFDAGPVTGPCDILLFEIIDDDFGNVPDSVARLNGVPVASLLNFDLTDRDGTALTSTALPNPLPPLGEFEDARFGISLGFSITEQAGITGNITSLVLVPEPGTGTLLAGGMIAIAAREDGAVAASLIPMADLLALSSRIIDEGVYEGPNAVNRMTTELSEVAPGVALIEAFSNVIGFETQDGLVLFDTSLDAFGPAIQKSLRGWREDAIHTIAYTHGHIDHVGGASVFVEEAESARRPRPHFVGHEAIPARFARYETTDGYNATINARQFGRGAKVGADTDSGRRFGPATWITPETTFSENLTLRVGDTEFELRHARGETDDHLWAWIPEHRALCVGDLMMWSFPNAGNPQKVQRYPLEWAGALREMAGQNAELLLPAHGLPIGGTARVQQVLLDVAGALESLVEQSLALMNTGARLDTLLHEVRLPESVLDKPYLRPVYDEPEFIVRNIWRLYGGWYDGNPAHLKPAPEQALADEVAALAGGASTLAARARDLAESNEWRLACELIEWAARAAPDDREIHGARAEIYAGRRKQELSLMARGIFGYAAGESKAIVDPDSDA